MRSLPACIGTTVAVVALLLQAQFSEGGLFGEGTGVTLLTESNFDKEARNTKHTVIVKYFANWCGHCKNFAPVFSQAAKKNTGIAKFAAVDCDAEKALCSKAGVKGFPTVIAYHRTKGMKKLTSPYQGGRTVSDLSKFVESITPNLVERVHETKINEFFDKSNSTVNKVIVIKQKPSPTNPRLKALAITHHKKIMFAEIIDKNAKTPIVQLIPPGEEAKAIQFDMPNMKMDFVEFSKFLKKNMKDIPPAKSESKEKTSKSEGKKDSEKKSEPKDKDAKPEAKKTEKAKQKAQKDKPKVDL